MTMLLLLFAMVPKHELLPPEVPEGVAVVWDGQSVHLLLSFTEHLLGGIRDRPLSLEIAFQARGAHPSAGFLNERLTSSSSGRLYQDVVLPVKPDEQTVALSVTLYNRTRNRTFLRLDRTFSSSPLAVFPVDQEGNLRLPVFTTEDTFHFGIRVPEPGSLSISVMNERKKTIFQDAMIVDSFTFFALPASGLRDGEYVLVARMDSLESRQTFAVWGLRGLPDRTWKEIVFLLQIAFPDSGFSGFLNLSPEERRERFWQAWRSTDPNPSTPVLEHYELFRRKIREANRRFGVGNLPGYRTHQGLVYLKYGPPDWVERRPFELNARPSEVWIYEDTPRRMIFVFVDRQGTGVYTLVDTDPPGLFP